MPWLPALACFGRGGQTGAISRAACGSGGGRDSAWRGEQGRPGKPPPATHVPQSRGRKDAGHWETPQCSLPRPRPILHEEALVACWPLVRFLPQQRTSGPARFSRPLRTALYPSSDPRTAGLSSLPCLPITSDKQPSGGAGTALSPTFCVRPPRWLQGLPFWAAPL